VGWGVLCMVYMFSKYFILCFLYFFPAKLAADDLSPYDSVALLNYDQGQVLEHNIIPSILNSSDLKLYKEVFDYQEKGLWEKAEKSLNVIDNKILMGHVIYHRLMHPSKYRASYYELSDWLLEYKDHPGARRAYKLALRRKPKDSKQITKPEINNYLRGYGEDYFSYAKYDLNPLKANSLEVVKQVDVLISKDELEQAYLYLTDKKLEKIPNRVHDTLLGKIAIKNYYKNNLDKASNLFNIVINENKSPQPWIAWWAGLNEVRRGRLTKALSYFKIVVNANYENDKLKWQKTAAAYWTGRIYLKLKKEDLAKNYFMLASEEKRSFYGHLAREKLGSEEPYSWKINAKNNLSLNTIIKYEEAKRAIALSQVGRYGEADFEIRNLYGRIKEGEVLDLLLFSELLNLPAVQIRLGSKLAKEGVKGYMRGLYPAPKWDEEAEFIIDRALLFALIRKESAFYLRAKSKRGARGLMQLMPRTARIVSGDRSLRGAGLHKLYLPKINLSIGQNFIHILMKEKHVSSSLIHLLASYNAGPSRVESWKKYGLYEDPLLFIESIPITETQFFIKSVLSDIWTYRDRFSQEKISRKELAIGKWPNYTGLDNYEKEYGKN